MGSFCSTGYGHATRSGKSGNNISPLRHSSSHARSIEVTPINTGHVIFKTTQIVLNRVLSLQVIVIFAMEMCLCNVGRRTIEETASREWFGQIYC